MSYISRLGLVRVSALAIAIGMAALGSGTAMAQTAPERDTATEGSDIVVTASRAGEQSIQKAALSIAVINPVTLNRNGTIGLTDLARSISSLNIVEAGPGINKIEMRGLTTGQLVPNSTSDVQDRSLVAVYIDDSAISLQGQNPDLKVLDLERVEVLRGPQGTLYGAGSMSGTIRYITIKPDATKTSGTVEGGISFSERAHEPNYNLRGVINLPIAADIAAIRLTGYYGRDAGYIDNVGALNRRDANSVDTFQGRAALRINASEGFTIDASYTYLDLNAQGLNRGFKNDSRYPGSESGSDSFPDFAFSSTGEEHNKDKMHLANLTLNYDIGGGTLTSSSSYTHRKLDFLESLEPTVAYFYQYAPAGPNNPFAGQGVTYNQAINNLLPAEIYSIKNKIDDFQQELRFSSDQTQRFRVTVGGFYQTQKRKYVQDIPFAGFDTLSYYALGYNAANPGKTYDSAITDGAFSSDDLFSGLQNIDEYQIAGFGEASFDITPQLTITAGARAFYWKQEFDLYFGGVYGVDTIGPNANIPLTVKDEQDDKGINPRFKISYQATDDLLLYAEAQKGFRYGGVNQPLPDTCDAELAAVGGVAPTKFGADSLWSYSVGEKARLLDRRLTINVDGFLIDWSRVQNRIVLPQCAYYYIQNVGKVRSIGVEVDIAARVTDALTLTLNGSYTDATTRTLIPGANNLVGDRLPNFPGGVVSLGSLYDQPIGNGMLHLQGNWQFRSSYQNTYNRSGNIAVSNTQAYNFRKIPAQDSLNASITYELGSYEIGIFGSNLTNGTEITNIVPKAAYVGGWQPGDYVTYARPRTIGIRAKARF